MRRCVAVLVTLLLPLPAIAGPFDELIATAPAQSNILVLVDVPKVLNSPIGKQQDWAGAAKDRYQSGAGNMPPGADRVLVAGQVDFNYGIWLWQAAVIDAVDAPDVRELARRERGELDSVVDRPTILSPRGYFTTLNPNRLVTFTPPNRQGLARWLTHAKEAKTPTVRPYLVEAAGQINKAPVVVALDLQDALDPIGFRRAAPGLVSIAKNKDIMPDALGRTLATARGLTFTATVGEKIEGTIRLDFGAAVGQYRPVLKNVFIEMLELEGMGLPELAGWSVTFPDKGMILTGELSPESFVRVLGLFTFAQAHGPAPTEDAKADPTVPNLTATKRYFDAVAGLASDVKKLRTATAQQYEKTAAWHESAARKIEQLSPRAVDPEALKFGQEVAKRLRAIAGSLRGVPIDLEQLSKNEYYTYQTYVSGYGWWGWPIPQYSTNVQTNIPEIREQQSKVVAEDEKKRVQLWGEIDSLTSRTKAELAKKYKGF